MLAPAVLLLAATATSSVMAQVTPSLRSAFPPTMDERDPKDVSFKDRTTPLEPTGTGSIKVNFPDSVEMCTSFTATVEGGKPPYMVTLIPPDHSWPVAGTLHTAAKTLGEMKWFMDDIYMFGDSFLVVVEDAAGNGGIDTKAVKVRQSCHDKSKPCACRVKGTYMSANNHSSEMIKKTINIAIAAGTIGGLGLGLCVVGAFLLLRRVCGRRPEKKQMRAKVFDVDSSSTPRASVYSLEPAYEPQPAILPFPLADHKYPPKT